MGDSNDAGEARFRIDGSNDIPPAERDRALLQARDWPLGAERALRASLPESHWEARGGFLFRRIVVRDEGDNPEEHLMWEALLRFPNAPVYATHEIRKKSFRVKPWPNFHTMRVLGHDESGEHRVDPGNEQIEHVYLLHNGLNETTDLLFHYRLAAWILNKRRNAVCILRPLPGHLTRYPFDGPYTAKPLDDYLHDPADLFRQFLRHMLETQWLLSTLVPRSQYQIAAGTQLLREAAARWGSKPTATGRLDDRKLAEGMREAWNTAFFSNPMDGEQDSEQAAEPGEEGGAHGHSADTSTDQKTSAKENSDGTRRPDDDGTLPFSKEQIDQPMLEQVITDLRTLLGWKPVLSARQPQAVDPESGKPMEPERPCIHVVGYSIGGFMAQAVFFAWPFAVSSCTNMFAGGALRDLAPTAFAHPEEWQAVLHGMRYELDRAFRNEHLNPTAEGFVAGIEESLFGYFTRIFYEVFLQYYRGGYSSRVAEFSRRLLFVVGGDDPIVRTRNVLDAGPPEGMTLLQIANVSHFPGRAGTKGAPSIEVEQRAQWLPEVGRVIAKFSERSEGLLNRTLSESWRVPWGRGKIALRDLAVDPPKDGDTEMDSAAFASEMNRLVDYLRPAQADAPGQGRLLIARNEIPPAFLEHEAFRVYAQAVHHAEEEIANYIRVLRARSERMHDCRDRITLLISEDSDLWFKKREERERFFSKSETASAARIPSDSLAGDMWDHFQQEWIAHGAVRVVKPDEYERGALGAIGDAEADRLALDKLSLTSLPDVWIALSDAVAETICGENENRGHDEEAIVKWAVVLSHQWHQEADAKAGKIVRRQLSAPGEGGGKQRRLAALNEWVESGEVIAIETSGAELNSRYRGRRLETGKDVRKALIHWAVAYQASQQPGGES